MFKEFALEPRLLHNWDRFQRFIGLFGVEQGRLIARFPKKWQQMVLDAVTCGQVEKARIEEAKITGMTPPALTFKGMWVD